MQKTFWQCLKIAVLSCILLLPSLSFAQTEKAKVGGTVSIMLRVHYEEMLALQGLRRQVHDLLTKNLFHGTQPFGYLYLKDIENGGVSFTAFFPEQHEAIHNLIKKYLKGVQVSQMGDEFTLRYNNEVEKQNANKVMPEVLEILYRRLVGFGIKQPHISRIGNSHILVEVPNSQEQNIEDFKQLITRSARLNFLLENNEMSPQEALVRSPRIGSAIFYRHQTGQFIPYLLDVHPVLTDRDIAKVVTGNDGREPFVLAVLRPNAAKRLERVTANNVGRRMAIMFEDMVYMAPTIMETIRSGQIKITNDFTGPEAAGFAVLLAAGSYPVSVEVVDERIEEVAKDTSTCCDNSNDYFEPGRQELRDEPEVSTPQEVMEKVIEKEVADPVPEPIITKEVAVPVAEPKEQEKVVIPEQLAEEQEVQPAAEQAIIEPTPEPVEEILPEIVEETAPTEEKVVEEKVLPVEKSLELEPTSLPEPEVLTKQELDVEETPIAVEPESVAQQTEEMIPEVTVKEIPPVEKETEEVVEETITPVKEEPIEVGTIAPESVTTPEPEVVEEVVEQQPVAAEPKVIMEETTVPEEDVIVSPSEMKSSSDALFDEQVIEVKQLSKVQSPSVTVEDAEPVEEEIAPELMEQVMEDEDVQMELSRFEQYLHGTEKLDFRIEDVTSTPRKISQPKTLKQLRIGDGL